MAGVRGRALFRLLARRCRLTAGALALFPRRLKLLKLLFHAMACASLTECTRSDSFPRGCLSALSCLLPYDHLGCLSLCRQSSIGPLMANTLLAFG